MPPSVTGPPKTKNCVSRNTLLGLVFQLTLAAEKSWRKLRGFKLLPDVAQGVRFKDGKRVPTETGEQQQIAACLSQAIHQI